MNDHAWIDYQWNGEKRRFAGQWPEDMHSAIGEAHIRLSAAGKKTTVEEMLREAGASIIEVHSIRPDGSIQGRDFPDFYVN